MWTHFNAMNKTSVALWTIQGGLAALFLFAGVMKLVMPIELMTAQMPTMPGWFLRFIGVAETLGAFGLLLPGLLRLRPGLTPLAALGLVLIMCGAMGTTMALMDISAAAMPFVVGVLAAIVAYGRWQLAPHREVARHFVLRPAWTHGRELAAVR
jgi:hypothetical protein